MLVKERQNKILEYLKQNSSASVQEISENVYASPSTIRRDLEELSELGFIKRFHGGASTQEEVIGGFFAHFRSELHQDEKNIVSELAKGFLKPSTSYFFDASTTCIPLAKKLAAFQDVRVTTIGIQTFAALSDFENVSVFLTGGEYDSKYKDFTGSTALETIKSLHADIFFFSCAGLSMDFGVSDHRDVIYKQAFWQNSTKHILLCGSSKFDVHCSYKCFDLSQIDYLITDKKPENPAYIDYFGDKLIY